MIGRYLYKLKKDGWLFDVPYLLSMMEAEYGNILMKAYKDLKPKYLYKSMVHGRDHIERVMLFGALIAMQQELNAADTKLLLVACSYHDIGRVNDSWDPEHGMRSARKLKRINLKLSENEVRLIQAVIAAHSLDDKKIYECMDIFEVADRERCVLIFKCLKDADGLDRVRINDLNEKYLRFGKSKRIAKFAMKIIQKDTLAKWLYESKAGYPPGGKSE